VLYNGMIAPVIPYGIRGAIWYQGESNASRANEYRHLFPTMIKNWRADWNQGEFPFYFVQLAPFKAIKQDPAESDWAELREAQLLTAKNLKNTGMAVITDVGDEKDIHPKQKATVGQRLALAARALTYGEKIEPSGPQFDVLKIDGSKAILSFKHVGGGLVAKGGPLTGFTIAGADKKWHNATAEIVEDKIFVSCPAVEKPVAVRFGWADYPVVNLWNKDGIPASPFRTDDWPGITLPKK
jgi:sialate O-acetylesterase